LYAYVAATLAFYCGLRACEIKVLCWRDIDHTNRLLHVRRSKTPAGWRSPTLNTTCLDVLAELHARAAHLGFAEPEHFVFPWHGRNKRLDPSKPMTSWRTAWRSMRKTAGLGEVRFHDGRHTAITTLAEKGLADWVIQAQVGHVAPSMMKTYSHIRRQALNEAADALEPVAKPTPTPAPKAAAARVAAPVPRVTSQFTSHSARRSGRVLKFSKKNGSPHWTISALVDPGSSLNGLFLIGSPRFREVSPNSDSAFAGVIDCVDLVNPLKHL
jgi:Phage integrase family